MAHAALAPCRVHKNATHGLGRSGEEVPAPVEVLTADEPQVRLVDQGRCVQRLAELLLRHPHGGEAAQFVVHERE